MNRRGIPVMMGKPYFPLMLRGLTRLDRIYFEEVSFRMSTWSLQLHTSPLPYVRFNTADVHIVRLTPVRASTPFSFLVAVVAWKFWLISLMRITANKPSLSNTLWMELEVCSNCKAQQRRTTSAVCLSVRVSWTRSLQPSSMWWLTVGIHRTTQKWRSFRFCWSSRRFRNQIYMSGMRWERGKSFDVSFKSEALSLFLTVIMVFRPSSGMRAFGTRMPCSNA